MKSCCGKPVNKQEKDGVHWVWCIPCGRNGKGATDAEAEAAFDNWIPDAAGFAQFVKGRGDQLRRIAAPFVKGEAGLFERMIAKNAEYIASLTTGSYAAIWKTEEGRASFARVLEQSIERGETLPDMGSVVPYGGTVTLIDDIEGFRFACTTGASSPFVWVNIEPVFAKDEVSIGKALGNFSIDFRSIPLDRGDLAGVAVYGERRVTGKIDGDFFPIKKLDAMAREYSKGYQGAIRDIDDFEKARTEGKVKTDTVGREYIEKTIKGKDGKPDWTKKVYFEDIDCQYTGASRDKMYCKLAGKSFLGPYMKVRNSAAAVEEVQNRTAPEPATEQEPPVDYSPAALATAAIAEPEPTAPPPKASKTKAPVIATSSPEGLF